MAELAAPVSRRPWAAETVPLLCPFSRRMESIRRAFPSTHMRHCAYDVLLTLHVKPGPGRHSQSSSWISPSMHASGRPEGRLGQLPTEFTEVANRVNTEPCKWLALLRIGGRTAKAEGTATSNRNSAG